MVRRFCAIIIFYLFPFFCDVKFLNWIRVEDEQKNNFRNGFYEIFIEIKVEGGHEAGTSVVGRVGCSIF